MIPIRDPRGRVIAFGGRVIGDGEPKYLNSPDTPLFDKGRTLYNLDRASPASRKTARIVVVEGYMDVVALAQAGIAEAVAPLGTALTEAQLERLWRMADVPLLCLDGDSAGQKAALRAAHRALPLLQPGRSLAFATLPAGAGSRRPDPGRRRARDRDGTARHRAAGRAPVVRRAQTRAAGHPRTARRPAPAADRPRRDRRPSRRPHRISRRLPPPLRRPVPAAFTPRAPFVPRGPRPKGGWKEPIAPITEDAKAIRAAGIDPILSKAVLAGLIRHPVEIARHMEVLHSLKLADGALGRLFEAVVDVAIEDAAVDSAGLRTILGKSGFDGIADRIVAGRHDALFLHPARRRPRPGECRSGRGDRDHDRRARGRSWRWPRRPGRCSNASPMRRSRNRWRW